MKDAPAGKPQVRPPASFDRERWNALVKFDHEIASAVEAIRPLGQKWVDEFARSYLALNDKQYLPTIMNKITEEAAAKRTAGEDGFHQELDGVPYKVLADNKILALTNRGEVTFRNWKEFYAKVRQ